MQETNFTRSAIDNRLLEIFGEDQCVRWQKENPEFLRYQAFELEFGFAIEDMGNFNTENYIIEKLESFDPVNFPVDEACLLPFNPLRYNIKRSYISRKYYSIGNSGMALVLFSGEELRRLFNSAVA